MCYVQLSRDAEAKRAMADFLAGASDEVAAYHDAGRDRWQRFWATRFPFRKAEDLEHLFEGLQKAGLP